MQLYRSSVFLSFDNLMPTFQFRHGRNEVRQWYAETGFGLVNDVYPGFFLPLEDHDSFGNRRNSGMVPYNGLTDERRCIEEIYSPVGGFHE
jgi:hypothetical protein